MKKQNRILKAQEFTEMIHHGSKRVNHSFVMYSAGRKEDHARIGISLSRKIGNAVERNKIKRQVRMMCSELLDFENAPFDAVLIIRFGYLEHSYADNKKNLEKLFVKATIE